MSALATHLAVARRTVQARMDRLVTHGVIRRFTVEVAEGTDGPSIQALCSIQLTHANTGRSFRRLQELPAVRDLYTTNGKWDLVAHLHAPSLDELDSTLASIREIPIVLATETSILLNQL